MEPNNEVKPKTNMLKNGVQRQIHLILISITTAKQINDIIRSNTQIDDIVLLSLFCSKLPCSIAKLLRWEFLSEDQPKFLELSSTKYKKLSQNQYVMTKLMKIV